jgi:RNA polymerase sigma-70 factor (ECF subfamily)
MHFQDMAYGYAYAILCDTGLAEDATQEAFIAAFRSLRQLKNPAAFPGWLKRIVRTYSIRFAHMRSSQTVGLTSAADQPASDADPAETIENRQLQERLSAAIQKLPESQRVAFVLHYINDYSQPEVAVFLESSVDAVKKQLQRARERLQMEMIDMARDHLRQRRPSRNSKLLKTVQAFAALPAAAERGELSMLELMLMDGVDVNAHDADGDTLLHWAARHGHIDGAELLLKVGASTDAVNAAGRTPLQLAMDNKHEDVVHLLRQRSAGVNADETRPN